MARNQTRAHDASLRPDLQALVSQVALVLGELELVIHEGSIQFIEVKPVYRVECCNTEDGTLEPRVETIRLHEIKPFVRSRLERAIFEQTGRFGHVKLKVRDGVVFDWHFARRHKYTSKMKRTCG
jgi:hypothetical protein